MTTKEKKLKEFFKELDLTQEEIAKRLNISQSLVSDYINGKKKFGKKSARKWADEFGISPLWLYIDDDIKDNQVINPTIKGDNNPIIIGENNTTGSNLSEFISELKLIIRDKENIILDKDKTIKLLTEELKERTSQINRLLAILENSNK